jgi:hypothetical protein
MHLRNAVYSAESDDWPQPQRKPGLACARGLWEVGGGCLEIRRRFGTIEQWQARRCSVSGDRPTSVPP